MMEVDTVPEVMRTDVEHNSGAPRRARKPESPEATDHEPYEISSTWPALEKATSKQPETQHNPLALVRTISLALAPSRVSFDPGPPPDGGRLAWTQTICAHFVVASCWGFVTSFGAFQTYYTSNLGLNPSDVSWIGSLQTTLLFLIGVPSGRAMDGGWFKLLVTGGALLQFVGVMCLSVSKQYWALLLTQGVVFGLGAGLCFTPTMALVSTYFTTNRNIAIGVVASGSCTGGLIFPAIVRQLLFTLGFPWTIRILAFIMLAFNIPAITLMRTRVPPRPSGPLVEWAAFKEPPYVLFIAGMFFAFWSLYFAFYYVGSYARNIIGLDYENSVNLLMIMVAVGWPGRIIPNYLADKYFGPLQSMIPFTFICGILFFGWTGVHSAGGLYGFASIYGIASGAIQSLWPATLSSLTTDLKKAGTRLGMGFTIISMATLTGPPLAGALVASRGGNYLYAQVWGGCSMVLAGCLLISARIAKVGTEVKRRV